MNWATSIVVLPTPETAQRLRTILSSSPIHIEFDTLHIVLAQTKKPTTNWQADEEAFFRARFVDFGIRYNEWLGYSQLVGSLDCPEMSARMNELIPSHEEYTPKLVFNGVSPPMARTNKSFLVSVADTLVLHEEEAFTFQHETILSRT